MRKVAVALLAGLCLLQAQAGTAPWWRWESQRASGVLAVVARGGLEALRRAL